MEIREDFRNQVRIEERVTSTLNTRLVGPPQLKKVVKQRTIFSNGPVYICRSDRNMTLGKDPVITIQPKTRVFRKSEKVIRRLPATRIGETENRNNENLRGGGVINDKELVSRVTVAAQLLKDFEQTNSTLRQVLEAKRQMKNPCRYYAESLTCGAFYPLMHVCTSIVGLQRAKGACHCNRPVTEALCLADNSEGSYHTCAQFAPTDPLHPWNLFDSRRCNQCKQLHEPGIQCGIALDFPVMKFEVWRKIKDRHYLQLTVNLGQRLNLITEYQNGIKQEEKEQQDNENGAHGVRLLRPPRRPLPPIPMYEMQVPIIPTFQNLDKEQAYEPVGSEAVFMVPPPPPFKDDSKSTNESKVEREPFPTEKEYETSEGEKFKSKLSPYAKEFNPGEAGHNTNSTSEYLRPMGTQASGIEEVKAEKKTGESISRITKIKLSNPELKNLKIDVDKIPPPNSYYAPPTPYPRDVIPEFEKALNQGGAKPKRRQVQSVYEPQDWFSNKQLLETVQNSLDYITFSQPIVEAASYVAIPLLYKYSLYRTEMMIPNGEADSTPVVTFRSDAEEEIPCFHAQTKELVSKGKYGMCPVSICTGQKCVVYYHMSYLWCNHGHTNSPMYNICMHHQFITSPTEERIFEFLKREHPNMGNIKRLLNNRGIMCPIIMKNEDSSHSVFVYAGYFWCSHGYTDHTTSEARGQPAKLYKAAMKRKLEGQQRLVQGPEKPLASQNTKQVRIQDNMEDQRKSKDEVDQRDDNLITIGVIEKTKRRDESSKEDNKYQDDIKEKTNDVGTQTNKEERIEENEKVALEDKIKEAREECADLTKRVQRIELENETMDQEIEKLRAQKAELERELANRRLQRTELEREMNIVHARRGSIQKEENGEEIIYANVQKQGAQKVVDMENYKTKAYAELARMKTEEQNARASSDRMDQRLKQDRQREMQQHKCHMKECDYYQDTHVTDCPKIVKSSKRRHSDKPELVVEPKTALQWQRRNKNKKPLIPKRFFIIKNKTKRRNRFGKNPYISMTVHTDPEQCPQSVQRYHNSFYPYNTTADHHLMLHPPTRGTSLGKLIK